MNNEQLSMSVECDIIGSIGIKSELMLLNDTIEKKTCSKCKQTLPLSMFNKKNIKTPHLYNCYCKPCQSLVSHNWRLKNLENEKIREKLYRHDNADIIRVRQKGYMVKWIARLNSRFARWKKGARDRNIPFDLTFEQIETMPLVCHYTGKELVLESNRPNTVSLDRIDSSKGYTPTNVVYCCAFVNLMKHTLSYENFLSVCKMIAKHHSN